MIIYGMDQDTMLLPKSYLNPKGLTNMWKLPTHVDMNEILHDSNLTVNMILQVLQKICRRSATCVTLTIRQLWKRKQKKNCIWTLLHACGLFRKVR